VIDKEKGSKHGSKIMLQKVAVIKSTISDQSFPFQANNWIGEKRKERRKVNKKFFCSFSLEN